MATVRRLLGFSAMTLVSLVVAHNLVFLLAYGSGYDEALAHSGHGGTWATAVAVVLSSGVGLLGLAAFRLYRLGLLARSLDARKRRVEPGPPDFARRVARLWLRLASATTVLFVVQENLEHRSIGEAMPGLSVLGSAEYHDAALVIGAIALVVAVVAALFGWRRDVLVARIRSVRRVPTTAPRILQRRPDWVELRHASIVVHQFSGRAPPQVSTT